MTTSREPATAKFSGKVNPGDFSSDFNADFSHPGTVVRQVPENPTGKKVTHG